MFILFSFMENLIYKSIRDLFFLFPFYFFYKNIIPIYSDIFRHWKSKFDVG